MSFSKPYRKSTTGPRWRSSSRPGHNTYTGAASVCTSERSYPSKKSFKSLNSSRRRSTWDSGVWTASDVPKADVKCHVSYKSVVGRAAFDVLAQVPANRLPLVAFQSIYERKYGRPITAKTIRSLWPAISYFRSAEGISFVSLQEWAARKHLDQVEQDLASEETSYISSDSSPNGRRRPRTISVCSSISAHRVPKVKGLSLAELSSQAYEMMLGESVVPLDKFFELYVLEYGQYLDDSDQSVHLEHLLECLPDFEVKWNQPNGRNRFSDKVIQMTQRDAIQRIVSSPAASKQTPTNRSPELIQFAREAKEIIKVQDGCVLPYTKFVPAYYCHYGRQCHVLQHGFESLAELLEAISDSVQVLGEGDDRLVTLTHGAQIRRFAAVVLKILRNHPNRTVYVSDFPKLHQEVIGKPFNTANYGVCVIEDLLCQLWSGTVSLTPPLSADGPNVQDRVLSLPRPQRTSDEVARTREFKADLIEILRCTPSFSMPLIRLVPAYHHHFNRQCRVSQYGFPKLIDLLQSLVPHAIQLIPINNNTKKNDNSPIKSQQIYYHNGMCSTSATAGGSHADDLLIVMSGRERSFALSRRLERIVRLQTETLTTDGLCRLYENYYGVPLVPEEWGAPSIEELLCILPNRRLTAVSGSGYNAPQLVRLTRSLNTKPLPPKSGVIILQRGQSLSDLNHYSNACNFSAPTSPRYALPHFSPSLVELARIPTPPSEWLGTIEEVTTTTATDASETASSTSQSYTDREESRATLVMSKAMMNAYQWNMDTASDSTGSSFKLDQPVNLSQKVESITNWTRTGRLI